MGASGAEWRWPAGQPGVSTVVRRAGAGETTGHFVPSIFALPYDTLNASVSQGIGEYVTLIFQAKNLTNSVIEEVYRSPHIDDDVLHSSYTKGVDYSLTLGVKFSF